MPDDSLSRTGVEGLFRRTDHGHDVRLAVSDDAATARPTQPAGSIHRPGTLGGLTCAVVTPIGPGHSNAYGECRATIEQAIRHGRGPFSRVEVIAVDDTAGKLGRSRARNDGVWQALKAGADWVFFLDADDLMWDTAFEEFRPFVDGYDAVWGLIVELAAGSRTPQLRLPQVPAIESLDELLRFDPFLTLQMGHFVRAEIAARLPFNESMNAGEDFDYYVRMWRTHRCVKASIEFFINRRGQHSTGPRSADGGAWMEAVHAIVGRERLHQGLSTESAKSIELRNRCTQKLQQHVRRPPQGVSNRVCVSSQVDPFAMARDMPWHGYVDVDRYDGDPLVLFSNNDDPAALNLAWTGEYEPTSARLWQKLAAGCELVLDIGAFTGLYAFLASRAEPGATVIGFEPLARNYSRFLLNRDLNRLANVHAVRGTAANAGGYVEIPVFDEGRLLTPHARPYGSHSAVPVDREVVPAVAIDEFLQQHRLPAPGLLRIDAAGNETQILDGMSTTLQSARPDLLLKCGRHSDGEALTRLLEPLGYCFFRLSESPRTVEQTDTLSVGDQLAGTNWVASSRAPEDIAALCHRTESKRKALAG